MIPTRNNTLLLTLRDFRTSAPQTLEISEQTDLAGVQEAIKDLFTLTYLDSQSS
jgi:hypothetical protein